MNTENAILSLDEIHQLIDGDDQSLRAYFASVPYPADISEFLEKVDLRQWPRLLRLIDDPEIRSEVVAQFDESRYKDLLDVLSPDEITDLLGQMESDDAADFIANLPFPKRFEVSLENRSQTLGIDIFVSRNHHSLFQQRPDTFTEHALVRVTDVERGSF